MDPADDPPIVDPTGAAPTFRQQRLDAPPLGIADPEKLLPHQGLLDSEALNHNSTCAGIWRVM